MFVINTWNWFIVISIKSLTMMATLHKRYPKLYIIPDAHVDAFQFHP